MNCPLCGESRREYLFAWLESSYLRCPDCGLIRVDDKLVSSQEFNTKPRFIFSDSDVSLLELPQTEFETIRNYLRMLQIKGLKNNSRVLMVGDQGERFKALAEELKLKLITINSQNELNDLLPTVKFNA
ncbi:MAG: hypothetical protein FJZ98_09860, partial [Chloroflexi bacterium]|nr:hypothetical protein [Chloroflexota bacterium]